MFQESMTVSQKIKSFRCTSYQKFMIQADLQYQSMQLQSISCLLQLVVMRQIVFGDLVFQLNSILLYLTAKMKERIYNKQNTYGDSCQMRSKQYSNATLQKQVTSYSPQGLPKNTNSSESPYERSKKRDYFQHYDMNKASKYDRGTPNYGRNDKVQVSDKYDILDKRTKYGAYEIQQKNNQDTFAEHSFGQISLQSDSAYPQNKRENAKRKGLQIKMSNINCINDKINSLLSMVKKDRVDPFREEQISPKRTQSPAINRTNSQTLQVSQNKSIKVGSKQQSEGQYKDYNRPYQRVRTFSALQEKASAKRPVKQEYSKYINEEDKYSNQYYKKNYPPSPTIQAETKNRQQGSIRYKYELNNNNDAQASQQFQRKQNKYSPYNQKYRKDNCQQQSYEPIAQKTNNRQGDKATLTPSKYEKVDLQLKYSPQKLSYDRSKNTLQNNFMPITLVQQERGERQPQQDEYKQPGIRIIDDRLKKIKQKINQSEYQNKKYQQRLQNKQQNNYVGKIYINQPPNHHFQLKVHPVVNDKPQTVKIAERLAYQIEVDARIRKARQEFNKIEGEDKWRDLELKLSKNGVRLTQLQIKELLTISPNEFTPFDSDEANQTSDLVKGFVDAQKHWQKQVSGCATMKSLKSQGFNMNQLDLNKKGYLSIQDFVCFVNLYTGHFHRNRDLAIIYRRLQLLERSKNQSGIDFSTFYRAFTI